MVLGRGGGEGRVPSLMAATVERGASRSFFLYTYIPPEIKAERGIYFKSDGSGLGGCIFKKDGERCFLFMWELAVSPLYKRTSSRGLRVKCAGISTVPRRGGLRRTGEGGGA